MRRKTVTSLIMDIPLAQENDDARPRLSFDSPLEFAALHLPSPTRATQNSSVDLKKLIDI